MARDKITRHISDSRAVALARVYLVPLVALTSAKGADVVFTVGSSHKQWAALGGRISKPLKTRKPSSRGLISFCFVPNFPFPIHSPAPPLFHGATKCDVSIR